jgi:phosphoglycolate phosphatase-like HAD superfamily hydrolase
MSLNRTIKLSVAKVLAADSTLFKAFPESSIAIKIFCAMLISFFVQFSVNAMDMSIQFCPDAALAPWQSGCNANIRGSRARIQYHIRKNESCMKGIGYHIKAVLFDFDGTLTRSGALDFGAIRTALGCPQGVPILEFIKTLEAGQTRQSAQALLDQFELEGARDSIPNPGSQEMVAWLKRQGVAVGIITRNSRASVMRALENFDRIGADDFNLMITRDDPPAPKPSGEGILWAAHRLGISAGEILVVGDPDGDEHFQAASCDFRIGSLGQVAAIVRFGGLPDRQGSC